jgi:hypothetical protein
MKEDIKRKNDLQNTTQKGQEWEHEAINNGGWTDVLRIAIYILGNRLCWGGVTA